MSKAAQRDAYMAAGLAYEQWVGQTGARWSDQVEGIQHLLTVSAGDRAWPMVREYTLWLRGQGRYREALALLEGCEAAGTTGERLSAALMFIVQMRRNLGDLSQTQVDMLNRALTLAQTDERRGSLQHEQGSLLQAQGDLPGARAKLERALEIKAAVFGTDEHPDVAASLHELAGVLRAQGDLPGARAKLERVLEIEARVYGSRDHYSTAISEMNLGFLMLDQGDTSQAVDLLRHAYEVFSRQLGPEHPHTQSLARLFADNTMVTPDPVQEATARARAAASRGDLSAAIEAQERAVTHLRSTAADDHDTLVRLSVLLYNLANYYSQVGRWDDAVAAFDEVVALDERTGHEDLASDREALEQARHMASLTPEEQADLEATADALSRIQALADQAKDAAIAVLRGELDRDTLIAWLGETVELARADEPHESPLAELAAYLEAVVALLHEETPPPVPPDFAARLAAIEAARRDKA